MYFPYLRGRQSELLALRTLLENDRLGEQVYPVIEPIKPTATFRKTLEAFRDHGRELYIVSNPQVGEFKKELDGNLEISNEFNELINSQPFKPLTIITKETDLSEDQEAYVMENTDHIDWFKKGALTSDSSVLFVPDQPEFRRKLKSVKKRILQADHFIEENRNADYLKLSSRPFSSDHLYYHDEGYYGFSDYSIVGSGFMEGGFAPRAVAIHIVYFTEDNELRIRHFTSETNDDISNPAGKFNEALEKLVKVFKGDKRNETLGLNQFIEHHKNGTYPGLGSVKQLSIMHHIELVGNYLRDDMK